MESDDTAALRGGPPVYTPPSCTRDWRPALSPCRRSCSRGRRILRRPAAPDAKQADALTRLHCAPCHAVPAPDVLPRAAWRASIEKMALLLEGKPMPGVGPAGAEGRRSPRTTSASSPTTRRARRRHCRRPIPGRRPRPTARFKRDPIGFPGALTQEPGVSNVTLARRRRRRAAGDPRDGHAPGRRAAGEGIRGRAGREHPQSRARLARRPGRRRAARPAGRPTWASSSPATTRGVPSPGPAGLRTASRRRSAGTASRAWRTRSPATSTATDRLDVAVAAFGWRAKGNVTVMLNRTPRLEARPPSIAW